MEERNVRGVIIISVLSVDDSLLIYPYIWLQIPSLVGIANMVAQGVIGTYEIPSFHTLLDVQVVILPCLSVTSLLFL